MIVVCSLCKARYKLTIAKTPGKAVTFKCGKCQNLIRLSPEEIEAGSSAGVGPAAGNAGAEASPAPPPADGGTVRSTCPRCGAVFVKQVADPSTTCYQCRIDSLVTKVREKYGVDEPAEPGGNAPEAPEPGPEADPRYTIRSADGLVLGPIKLRTVAVLAREKRISGREMVSCDGCAFAPLMSYHALAELFPALKEILDTDGLEDKVEEAFMAAFGADEGEAKSERADAAEPAAPEPVPEPAAAEEKASAATVAEPSLDEGTEFELGEEGMDAGEEGEVIEDLEAIEPPPDARYRIRYPDGLVLGPVKFGTVTELFKTGHLTGQEEVQRDEDLWVPFAELPELAVLIAEAGPVEDDVMELTDVLEDK